MIGFLSGGGKGRICKLKGGTNLLLRVVVELGLNDPTHVICAQTKRSN